MFQRWFTEHPRSIGEGYFEHQRNALRFSAALLSASAKCLIHALVPCLFKHAASSAVAQLNERMSRRSAHTGRTPLPSPLDGAKNRFPAIRHPSP